MIDRLKRYYLRCLHRVTQPIRGLGAKNGFVASIYYTFFDSSFRREQAATLAGFVEYERSLKIPGASVAVLRRNTHRLEKGLLMRPRRNVFAREYIEETVNAFSGCLRSEETDHEELKWSSDVLAEYFRVVDSGNDPTIDRCRERFHTYVCDTEARRPKVPYRRALEDGSPVEYDDLLKLAIRRRSVRWFEQRAVDRSLIDKAVILASQAPSACNRQPFEFRVFDDRDLLKRILKLPIGVAGYDHNIPCLIVIVGDLGNYFSERDRHLIYIDGSLAAMGLLFALETLGLSGCCINWPDLDLQEEGMAAILGLNRHQRPVMLVAVGYPDADGEVAYSAKKSLNVIRKFNEE